MISPNQYLRVVAAILFNDDGRILIAQRPAGKTQAGRWEFPGGKIMLGETPQSALCRELREELGVEVSEMALQWEMSFTHEYSDSLVELTFYRVSRYSGEPCALDGQRLEWADVGQLLDRTFLEADMALIQRLIQGKK